MHILKCSLILNGHLMIDFIGTNVKLSLVVNPCDSTPCANSGNCTAMGPFNFTCQCAPGYTGPVCEDEIDGCLSITCPNNSECVNGSYCVCLPGFEFSGETCEPSPTTDKTTGVCVCMIERCCLTMTIYGHLISSLSFSV